MSMHDDSFDCIDRTMLSKGWIDIASIKIDAVCVNSKVSSANPIWV